MISACGHTAGASKTSMSERQSQWGLGSKSKQIVENVLTTSTENLQQTVQPTGVGLSTVYKIRSKAKYIGGLFIFEPRRGKIGFLHMRKQRRSSASASW